MGATGESPRRISDAGFDPAWSPDGRQLVYTTERITDPYRRASVATLWVVDVAAGERRQLNEIDAAGPDWSPGGQRIAFWTHRATVQGQRDIWTIDVDGTKPLPVTEDVHTDWDPMWSPDGRWLYFFSDRGGSPDLWRVAIDQKTGRLGGEPQPVTTGIARVVGGDIAADGQSIVLTAIRARGDILRAGFDPEALRLTGSPSSILSSSNPFNQVDISPDGRRLAYRTTAPREILYIADLEGGGRRKILDDEHRNRGPRFSPDGEWLVFYSNRNGSYEEWAIQTTGTGLTQITDEPDLDLDQASWSSDGRRLFVPIMSDKETCLAYADLGDGGIEGLAGQTRELERLPGSDDFAMDTLSPDDRHVVGQMLGPRGEWLTAVYSLETSTARVLEQANGQPYRHEAPTWLDERRVVFWDHELDSAVVLDIESNEARFIPDVPGPSEILLTPDQRTVVINLLRYESDIWMLTLSE